MALEVKEGPQWIVHSLAIEGVVPTDDGYLRSILRSIPGEPYSEANIAADRDTPSALTVMPRTPISLESERVNCSTAALVAAYTERPSTATRAKVDERFTMLPPVSMRRAAAWQSRNTPRRFTAAT